MLKFFCIKLLIKYMMLILCKTRKSLDNLCMCARVFLIILVYNYSCACFDPRGVPHEKHKFPTKFPLKI